MKTNEINNAVLEPPRRVSPPAVPTIAPRPRSGKMLVIFAVLFALTAVIYAGIRSRTQATMKLAQSTEESLVPSVNVVYPQSSSATEEIALPGNTQAFTDTPIYARTSGYLKSWRVDIGAHVKQGDLLAEIETPEVDRQLEQGKAEVENAKANLEISQITARRSQQLLKANTISHQEADQAGSDLNSKQALFESSKANVRRLEQLQSFEKIYAPFDGVITARSTDIGALIQSGDTSNPKELFHMVAIHILRVYISVPEVYASAAKTGEKVQVTLDSLPGETFTGILVRNSEAIDSQSRTLNVEVDVENPAGRLLPGAYAFVRLKIPASANSVTIPANTLLFRSEGLRAGVVRDGHVQLVPVTVGHDFGNTLEVVSGVTAQDALILDPSDSLADGSAVRVETPPEKSVRP